MMLDASLVLQRRGSQLDHLLDGQLVVPARLDEPQQRGAAGERLEAAAVAAAARSAVELDGDVPQLARQAAMAFEDASLVDDAQAEASPAPPERVFGR